MGNRIALDPERGTLIEGSIEDILAVEKLLGIEHLENEARGYPRLTAKYGKQIGNVMEARFDKSTVV